jgi:alpha-D-ribose 1-methylphosphonate 5-phosphate C-P lyase
MATHTFTAGTATLYDASTGERVTELTGLGNIDIDYTPNVPKRESITLSRTPTVHLNNPRMDMSAMAMLFGVSLGNWMEFNRLLAIYKRTRNPRIKKKLWTRLCKVRKKR